MPRLKGERYTSNTSYNSYPDEDWIDRAACLGMDPSKFDLVMEEDYVSGALPSTLFAELNEEHFLEARRACEGCPVLSQCEGGMGDVDGRWVFRAGVSPLNTFLVKDQEARLRKESRSPARNDNLCSGGLHEMTHENSYVSEKGHRRCRECKREAERMRRLQKSNPEAWKALQGDAVKMCRNGKHEMTSENTRSKDSAGGSRCRACWYERKKAWRDKRRNDRAVSALVVH